MLDFIFSYKNSLSANTKKSADVFSKDFLYLFEKKLKESYIHNIELTETQINFKAPIARFTWNGWNVFNPISEGSVKITKRSGKPWLHFNFKFTEFFIIAILMTFTSLIAFLVGIVGWGILLFLADWLLFFFVSRTIFTFRINSLIAKTIQTVNDAGSSAYDSDRYLKDEWAFINFVFLRNREENEALG